VGKSSRYDGDVRHEAFRVRDRRFKPGAGPDSGRARKVSTTFLMGELPLWRDGFEDGSQGDRESGADFRAYWASTR